MAGNKINTKTKGKDDKSKTNKNSSQNNDDADDIDFALLRKPIHTSITGFAQARKIFDCATEELKDLLSNECDLLYECKVCRNIFRSLANFLSHKRVYCKEKFNSACHAQFLKSTSTVSEMLKINRMEEGYQESLKDSEHFESENDDIRIPITKDLTTMVEKITATKGVNNSNTEEQKISFQTIPTSSVAVFQNVEYNNDTETDSMRAQVTELDKMLSRQKAVLQSDGKFEIQSFNETPKAVVTEDNVIQISDDEDFDSNDLKCKICDQQFATQKTLKFHMKYKHLESRLVYPCPDCLEIFSTSWSVYRHLFKVHRKTSAQIRRLRDSIQSKAFKKNNPPAFYEKRKNNMKISAVQKISEEERFDQENQAWMDNMECDGELPRCGGCGRTFERRAALAAHTHTCQPRSRALARRPPETKKIEIQIRKDYNKGPPPKFVVPIKSDNENKFSVDDIQIPIKPQKQIEKLIETDKKQLDEMVMDVDDFEAANDAEEPLEQKTGVYKPLMKLPFAQQAEKSNTIALKQKVLCDIEIGKLLCKKCDYQSNNLQGLYDHMAGHYKWVRYSCKLCHYKHYNFDNIQTHIKMVHKLKGDTDFYYSTIKAISGTEALELCESNEESMELAESPESRQPSRCSSDSGRMSDDSSTSSTRVEGSRRRKLNPSRSHTPRKRECLSIDDGEDSKDGDASMDNEVILLGDCESSSKTFEENSSDMDDVEEKFSKRNLVENTSSVASRRPVRKKTKPKHEDFEYDLSNLLKMEAQGYRDSQLIANSKVTQSKKKSQQELQNNYENVNKDYCGALMTLSKKAVENGAAHLKTANGPLISSQKDPRSSNIFVRPLVPKPMPRLERISPKKDNNDDLKEVVSPDKDTKCEEIVLDESVNAKDETEKNKNDKDTKTNDKDSVSSSYCGSNKKNSNSTSSEKIKSNLSIPAIVPFKFRRQSVEVIKSPIINKNINDFTKAGMKTKILVIKPINRNKDGTIQSTNTPLKFQTIKLKDPNKPANDTKISDQVVVVKVPKVETAMKAPTPDTTLVMNKKVVPLVIATQGNVDAISGSNDNLENNDITTETRTEEAVEAKNDSETATDANNTDEEPPSKSPITSSDILVKEEEIDKPV